MNKRIYLASPHLGEEEKKFVEEAFQTNWIAPLGPNVNQFETELANYVQSKHGAVLSSGTAAIHLGLKALGVTKGDLVFCSTLTFSASCNPIIYQGATPVFIDSEIQSWNMSPFALRKAFEACEKKGQRPKAVIVVHLYGQNADMESIKSICDAYNVPILEDAAESLGATYKGQHSGTFGEIGIYSFNGNKIITTSGGGMLVSKHQFYVEKARFWATQSRENERHYEHKEIGYNYRMSNVLAGIGRGQLKVLNQRIEQKKAIFQRYEEALKDIKEFKMMPICEDGEPNYWLSCATLSSSCRVQPLDIILALEIENIESRPIWKPMHLQPIFKDYPYYSHSEKSVSEAIFNRGICLPSDTKMTIEEQDRVISIIRRVCLEKSLCTSSDLEIVIDDETEGNPSFQKVWA